MHRTYELYVRHADGAVKFEALTLPGPQLDLVTHVRGLLEARGAEAIEVRIGGEHLFTLAAPQG